jgi:hypothetical protein
MPLFLNNEQVKALWRNLFDYFELLNDFNRSAIKIDGEPLVYLENEHSYDPP